MRFPHTRLRGLVAAPAAIEGVALGRYLGAVIVEL
jgi:hypothetical protein